MNFPFLSRIIESTLLFPVEKTAVDFRFTPAEEAFREELRTWLAEHLTDDYRAVARVGAATDDEHWAERLAWEKELAAAGWLGISWPKEYGGRGGTLNEEIIFLLEHGRAGAPYWV